MRAYDLSPLSVEALRARSSAYSGQANYLDALADLDQILGLRSDDYSALIDHSWNLSSLGQV